METTDDIDEQADSGLGSLDFRSETPGPASPPSRQEDLGTALSAMNIEEDEWTEPPEGKDSGVYVSSSTHTSQLSQASRDDIKDTLDRDLAAHRLSHAQMKGFVQINSDWDCHLNLHIINERTAESLDLIALAPDPDWLNMQNTLYQTPLHLAVLTRQPQVARRLVCAGANVLLQDHSGNTPLHCACALGYEEIVRHFLVPVHYSETRQNRYKIPFQRLPQTSDIRNFGGDTCLHLAAHRGYLRIVSMLLDTGADPNVGDGKAGRTVLHHAAEAGNRDLVRLLLSKRRVDLNALDYAKRTPARLASGRLQENIVRLLEKHGVARPPPSDTSSDNDDAMECRHDG